MVHIIFPIKVVVSEDYGQRRFREGFKIVVAFWCFGSKTGFFKKGMIAIPFFNFCCGDCWWMLVPDYKKGGGKITYKMAFLATPFLRGGKGWKEERGQVSKKHHHFDTVFGAPQKTGFHPFGPKQLMFFRVCSNPLLWKRFQEKLVVAFFFGKGYVRKGAKNDNCFGGL